MIKVGVLGIGMMGKGMVKNLIKAGYQVYAYDPIPKAAEKARELGATVLDNPKEVAEKVEFLLTSLPTSQAVADAVGASLPGMKTGTVICDMSTAAVSVERGLYEAAKAQGVGYLDCPVSGGPTGAENATMSIMVGGDIEVFEKAKPIFEKISGKIFYVGAIGSGQIIKMCNNIVVAVTSVALAEAFATAVKAGVSAQTAYDIFKVSTAGSRTLDIFGENMVKGTYENAIFACGHMHKDVDLFMGLANELKISTLLSSITHQIFNAAMKKGYGQLDMAAYGV
ncbi:MAG: NAD(P)-dependent oxidoreductase [Firmicutes bacterium HGW-Firmicutes-12]|nr:MAG: NAD(P)-dependent oxidoreductase [Firmicutes bacterium HGW-Firmicutes-12]